MCKCNPRPRTIKTRSGRWICSRCLNPQPRDPQPTSKEAAVGVPDSDPRITEVALVRHDLATGAVVPTNLSTFLHDLDADRSRALESLLLEDEALTPKASYRLEAVPSPSPAELLVAESERLGWPSTFPTDVLADAAELLGNPELYAPGFGWLLTPGGTHLIPPVSAATALIDGLATAYPEGRWYFGARSSLEAIEPDELVNRLTVEPALAAA